MSLEEMSEMTQEHARRYVAAKESARAFVIANADELYEITRTGFIMTSHVQATGVNHQAHIVFLGSHDRIWALDNLKKEGLKYNPPVFISYQT